MRSRVSVRVLQVLAVLGALVAIVVIAGYLLPQSHRASRERVFAASPALVYAAISTPSEFPSWRSNVSRVEILPADSGRPSYREFDGSDAITYRVEEQVPERRLVTRISDASLPFGGRWTFEISADPGGARLRITEDGEVYNPVFRFVSRYIMGHHATIDHYMDDLARKFQH